MGYVKVIHSGSLLEVFRYEKSLPIRRKKRAKDSYRKFYHSDGPRSEDSIRRARASFKRLVRVNLAGSGNPALFTFTMHQKLPYRASSKLFTEFAYRLGKRSGKEFRYIAVPEFQKRGALHWHVLIWGLHEEAACIGEWKKKGKYWFFDHRCSPGRQCERRTRVLSRLWLRGFCDGIATDGHARLATYLTKYLSKSMHDKRTFGKKSYHASRNILRPMYVGSGSAAVASILSEHVIPNVKPLTEREYPSQWLGMVDYKQYEINSYDSKGSNAHDSEGQS